MPVPATNDEFLDLIRKSGVVDEPRLQGFLDRVHAANATLPPQPTKFASWLVRDGVLTYFQAEQILQGKYKRFTIGKYKVLEKLGVGGMGQVFLCEHKMMRRKVAVKVLPVAKSDDDAARDRFYREARAVAALDHPNIVRAHDVDQDDNLHFLVMEFVDGTNLHDLVKKHGALNSTRAAHYIYASAAGLDYANTMGIVHRDIKPSNILVDRAGVVKVLDMGLALFFRESEDDGLTRTHEENVLGTADYLAPEQAIDSHTVDIRADIYSLGCTFYYLLTGRAPFPEGSIAQKLLMHQSREPRPVLEMQPEVPVEIVGIIAKMMKKEPAERYATPGALMADLASYVQTPISPPSDAEMPKFSRAAVSVAATRGTPNGVLLTGAPSGIPAASFSNLNTAAAGSQTSALIASAPATPAIWEDIASAETTADTATDTSPAPTQTPPRPSRWNTPAAPPPSPRRKMLVVAGIGAGTMLAALAAYLAFGGKPSPVVAPTNSAMMAATGPRTLYVTRGTAPAPEATFPSLAAALKKTAPGDTIQLLDDPHEEPPVRINAASAGKFKGVTIESGIPGKMVVVRHAAAVVSGKHGLLELNGTDGLVIRNLTFDAGGRSDYCLMLSGVVDGLLIENVTFKSATTANVLIDKAIAAPDRRARFDRVLFRVDQGNCDGVQFLSDARTPISNFSIENCRFLGKGWNALHLRGPARNIEFYGNRVYHFDNGIHLQGPEHSCQVKIIGNTFLNLGTTGLWTNGHPPENPPSEVVLERNYFAKTKEILRGPGNKVPGLKAAGNARDKATSGGAGGLDPKAVEVSGTIPSPESDDDSRFLRLDERSPLRSFGPNKLKIGAQ